MYNYLIGRKSNLSNNIANKYETIVRRSRSIINAIASSSENNNGMIPGSNPRISEVPITTTTTTTSTTTTTTTIP